jgi:hypothetical protein
MKIPKKQQTKTNKRSHRLTNIKTLHGKEVKMEEVKTEEVNLIETTSKPRVWQHGVREQFPKTNVEVVNDVCSLDCNTAPEYIICHCQSGRHMSRIQQYK